MCIRDSDNPANPAPTTIIRLSSDEPCKIDEILKEESAASELAALIFFMNDLLEI